MPYADYGEKVNFSQNQFLKLKEKGAKIQFQLLGKAYIEGKHFFTDEKGDWDVQPCPRVNKKEECDYCQKYFKILSKAKKTGDKTIIEQSKKEARKYSCAIVVYYPILLRDNEEFEIFQTTFGVRKQIEDEVELGTKVLETEWIVLRTQEGKKVGYKLSKVDSKDVKPFSEKETIAIEKGKEINLEDIVGGGADDESGVANEANSEVEQEEEAINFEG